jgi:Trypsin
MLVKEIFVHPNWNPNIASYNGDISVIVMDGNVEFNRQVQPICLLSTLTATNGVVVGYGKSEDTTKRHENIPKKLDVHIPTNEKCFLDSPSLAAVSSGNTFCAGTTNGHSVCFGDSGGGLYVKQGNVFYLKGLVSASLKDANENCDSFNYAIYTDVLKFKSWIDNPSHNNLCQKNQDNQNLMSLCVTTSQSYNQPNLPSDRMLLNQCLPSNSRLQSPNGCFFVALQPDGNLVMHKKKPGDKGDGIPVWSTHTNGHEADRFCVGERSLALCKGPETKWLAFQNVGIHNITLMQNDGNFVVYDQSNSWATWSTDNSDSSYNDKRCF